MKYTLCLQVKDLGSTFQDDKQSSIDQETELNSAFQNLMAQKVGRPSFLPRMFFSAFSFLRCAAIGAAEKVEEGNGSPDPLQSAEAKRHVGSPFFRD